MGLAMGMGYYYTHSVRRGRERHLSLEHEGAAAVAADLRAAGQDIFDD